MKRFKETVQHLAAPGQQLLQVHAAQHVRVLELHLGEAMKPRNVLADPAHGLEGEVAGLPHHEAPVLPAPRRSTCEHGGPGEHCSADCQVTWWPRIFREKRRRSSVPKRPGCAPSGSSTSTSSRPSFPSPAPTCMLAPPGCATVHTSTVRVPTDGACPLSPHGHAFFLSQYGEHQCVRMNFSSLDL